MELTPKARQILDDMLSKTDTDQRVNRLFTEADMVEMALRVLKIANETAIGSPIIGLAVCQFELDRTES